MRVVRLGLTDFRNYRSCELTFEQGITTFVGANGQGKTNLVEAVHYCSSLSSHRVATDAPLIRSGAASAQIRLELLRDERSQLIELEINSGRPNRARLNRNPVARPREVVGVLRTVIFAPEDLALVKGDPSVRRAFLDELLVQRQPRFAAVRADYDRVLKQRNALLKSANGPTSDVLATLAVWDEQLLNLAADLTVARFRLVAALAPFFAAAYQEVAGREVQTHVEYQPAIPTLREGEREQVRAELAAALEVRRREEFARGVSVVGPHRDELTLGVGGLPVRGYASHGESWSAALAMRLAAFELLRADGPAHEPVLILDDVFAELDEPRRESLVGVAARAEQVLVTAAVGADIPGALGGRLLEVSAGEVGEPVGR